MSTPQNNPLKTEKTKLALSTISKPSKIAKTPVGAHKGTFVKKAKKTGLSA
jgi:hypothetical protein